MSANNVQRSFVANRTLTYLPVALCRNVTWNRTQTGVPYDTIVTDVIWLLDQNKSGCGHSKILMIFRVDGGAMRNPIRRQRKPFSFWGQLWAVF